MIKRLSGTCTIYKCHTSVINVVTIAYCMLAIASGVDVYYYQSFSYKQQLHDATNQVTDLTNRLQEITELRDAETGQLKTALASVVQSLQQELQSNATQMATKVNNTA